MNPIDFYVTLSTNLVTPLIGYLQWFLPIVIIGMYMWALATRALSARPDLLWAATARTFLLAFLVWLAPIGAQFIDAAWGYAFFAGNQYIKNSFGKLLEDYGGIYEIMGVTAGGLAMGAKYVAIAGFRNRSKAGLDLLAKKIFKEVEEEGLQKGWTQEQIGKEFSKRFKDKIKSDPSLADHAKLAGTPKATSRVAEGLRKFEEASRYLNLVGLALLPLLWLFVILGLSTGLIVNLAKLAIPIALMALAISPRSGAMFMSRLINIVIGANAAALIVPIVVGVTAWHFVGGPAQEVKDAWNATLGTLEQMRSGGFFEAVQQFIPFLSQALHTFWVLLVATLKILVGVFLLYVLGAVAASAVPYVIGQVFIATGLLETLFLGRGAISLIRPPRLSVPDNNPYQPVPPVTAGAAPPPQSGPLAPRVSPTDLPSGPPIRVQARIVQTELSPPQTRGELPGPPRPLPPPKKGWE